MEMHQIRYFLAVARTLNFTQAADECHVAQPSLSRAIKKLEEELGGDLFRRERALTHLTELGRIMLPLLTQAYDTAASAKTLASAYRKGGLAPLRLALSQTIDMRLLTRQLSSFIEAMPDIELVFFRGSPAEVAERLKSGDFEIAVAGPLEGNWDRFRSYTLFRTTFHLFMNRAHPLANQQSVALSRLAGERLMVRPYCELADVVSRSLAEHGVAMTEADTLASDHDVLAMLEANLGISLLPATTPRSDVVLSVPVEGLDVEGAVMLHTVIGRQHSPAAAGLIQLLRAANWSEAQRQSSAAAA
jgi:DNA-binding transcriptional LysR family regulator